MLLLSEYCTRGGALLRARLCLMCGVRCVVRQDKQLEALLLDAVESLLRTAEAKNFLDNDRAREAGFCPLRHIAEYLMRNNPRHPAVVPRVTDRLLS